MSNTSSKDTFSGLRGGLRDGAERSEDKSLPRSDADRAKKSVPRRRFIAGMRSAKLGVPEELLDGYQFVTVKEISLISDVTPANSDSGDKVSRIVSRADGPNEAVRAYLMKIDMETYEARQAQIQEPCDIIEEAILKGRASGQEDRNFYTPRGHKNSIE
jgi:hypothetical protein